MPTIEIKRFPGQFKSPFEKTSEKDPAYNCIAWALGVNDVWYEPPTEGEEHLAYWPDGLPIGIRSESYLALFEHEGYEVCESQLPERGYEKIAFYFHKYLPNRPHAARMLRDGRWTSKIGKWEDVTHTLVTMEDGPYGDDPVILRRAIPGGWTRLIRWAVGTFKRFMALED